jgi:TonB family protein
MNAVTSANLLAWALQVGVVVLVAAPLPRLLGLWSPRARMAYWRAVLVVCLLAPLLQPWVTRPEAQSAPAPTRIAAVMNVVGGSGTAAGAGSPTPGTAPAFGARWSLPFGAADVLLAGIVLRLGWLGLGVITVWRLRRAARPLWPRPGSIDRAATLAETDAEFLVSATTSRPVTCGLLWPVVLVPRNFETFPEHEQTAIACHELLHVGRADWVRNAADEFIRAALWFHPAIWWLINEIQLAREQIVDREAVRRLGARQPYLEALLRMARPAPRLILTPASLFLKRAHLRQRVTLLLKEASMSRTRLAASLAIMAFVIFVGGRLATAAFPLQQAGTQAPSAQAAAPKLGSQSPVTMAPENTGDPGAPAAAEPSAAGAASGIATGAGAPIGGRAETSNAPAQGVQQTVVGANVLNVVRRVDPVAEGLTGRAIVGVVVDASGNVTLAGPQGSTGAPYDVATSTAAVEAAKQWTFDAGTAETRATFLGFNLTPHNTAGLVDAPVVRIGGAIPPPQKIVDVKPVYPLDAQQAGIQGVQIFEISVDPSGVVLDVRALRGNYLLVRAAMDAVLQWTFSEWAGPERRLMTVTVNFMLGTPPHPVSPPEPGQTHLQAQPASGSPVQYGAATDWPPEAVRVGGNIRPPTKTVDARAVYPAAELKAGVQGVVICDLLIGPDGKVKDVRVLRSIPVLDQAAVDAVRQWEFTPTLLNGNPIPVIVTVSVNFTIG